MGVDETEQASRSKFLCFRDFASPRMKPERLALDCPGHPYSALPELRKVGAVCHAPA